jgi:hypothetical protein
VKGLPWLCVAMLVAASTAAKHKRPVDTLGLALPISDPKSRVRRIG